TAEAVDLLRRLPVLVQLPVELGFLIRGVEDRLTKERLARRGRVVGAHAPASESLLDVAEVDMTAFCRSGRWTASFDVDSVREFITGPAMMLSNEDSPTRPLLRRGKPASDSWERPSEAERPAMRETRSKRVWGSARATSRRFVESRLGEPRLVKVGRHGPND